MENVWLGGWSSEGKDWTWVSSGSTLSTSKSSTTQYPPWLEGHPVAISKSDYYYQRRSRCLILDRHLCPDQIAPVFLDLDCEKERPFVCQDGEIEIESKIIVTFFEHFYILIFFRRSRYRKSTGTKPSQKKYRRGRDLRVLRGEDDLHRRRGLLQHQERPNRQHSQLQIVVRLPRQDVRAV